ncbi:aldo/keto reductase [Streptomyces flaveolus]|uniref:aldo/keto reductase n=1 Tax=Streptomyces flaveolus TaxID=67297 RepID=UPI0033C9CF02
MQSGAPLIPAPAHHEQLLLESEVSTGSSTPGTSSSTPSASGTYSYRRKMPRFAPEAFEANLAAVETVREIARAHDAAPGQVALAWLLAKADDIVPIPGTLHVSRLEENSAAADLPLTSEEIARLDTLPVVGVRQGEVGHNWFDGVTPPQG